MEAELNECVTAPLRQGPVSAGMHDGDETRFSACVNLTFENMLYQTEQLYVCFEFHAEEIDYDGVNKLNRKLLFRGHR